ncbi:uncharacterized protein GGS25DRAFT_499731 [Hypoxylon fragiforme]|uniref:uncharacterized protein n=1 Tax=Hypoxylon fragiforme TaxID=63214 RepID=UPI0020C683D3|nr:uncharacterized protein GGS25DRAFT_499731 [Hypoxylon fragiforme]KAI2606142.1 hypothetical protein GGS25DRAFT_499731 [Hypoxylon fragiforme]
MMERREVARPRGRAARLERRRHGREMEKKDKKARKVPALGGFGKWKWVAWVVRRASGVVGALRRVLERWAVVGRFLYGMGVDTRGSVVAALEGWFFFPSPPPPLFFCDRMGMGRVALSLLFGSAVGYWVIRLLRLSLRG